MATQVGIREAKAKLSALIGRTRRGDTITITDRGRPVARLVPIPDRELSLTQRLEEMELRGQIAPPLAGPMALPPTLELEQEGYAQQLLQADRDGS